MSRKRGRPEEVKGERSKAKGNEKLVQMDASGGIQSPPENPLLGKPELENKSEIDIPPSEINKSEIDSYRVNHPTSEIQNKSEIVNRKSEMEIHHHPEVEKKGFKEYLLEGLMIFIAVMMGFFAESYREHLSDSAKEHDYVANIKKDLVADTVSLSSWIPGAYARMQMLDTLITLLEKPGFTKNGAQLYYYARLSTRTLKFDPSMNTINELKNSGNYRLIKNQRVINGLMDFEKIVNNYSFLNDVEQKENELVYPLIGSLFDATVFPQMSTHAKGETFTKTEYNTSGRSFIHRPSGNPQLRNADKDKLNLMIYYIHQRETSMYGETRMLTSQYNDAAALIKLINQEYKLADD